MSGLFVSVFDFNQLFHSIHREDNAQSAKQGGPKTRRNGLEEVQLLPAGGGEVGEGSGRHCEPWRCRRVSQGWEM